MLTPLIQLIYTAKYVILIYTWSNLHY
jgi:hypothetical protein